MTNPHAFSSPMRLRPGSPRALNQLRLLWLLGWTGADIAAHFGVNRTTIWRRLKAHALNGPEKPDERETLAETEARAMMTDALMRGDERAAKELAGLLPKMAGPARPKAAPAGTPKGQDGTYTEDWRRTVVDELEQLVSLGAPEPADAGSAPRGSARIRSA